MSPPVLHAVKRANIAMLKQKTHLIGLLTANHGKDANSLYSQVCPIVKASIGQHMRHSLDHIELAAKVAAEYPNIHNDELHYDLRTRGGNDENDIEEAMKRIMTIMDSLENSPEQQSNRPVQAYFMLSGDPTEFQLPSTVERELGFSCHHAIHHMAMVKIIATETLGISSSELSRDFGRAPSTVVHDEILR